MTLLANHPLSSTFSGVTTLQTKGMNLNGAAYPTGVPGSIDLVNGTARVVVNDTDAETYGERRSEMAFSHQLDPTGERWYTWRFMVPSTWGLDDTSMAVMQIHETPDAGHAATAVQFVLLLENGQLVARVPVNFPSMGTDSYRMASRQIEFDRWYSMCFHANWRLDTTGFWELFIDRVPMFRQYGLANAYDFIVGGYLKLGIYNFGATEGWGTKSAYFSNVSVWSGNDGYQTVMGDVPVRPSRILQL